MPRGRPSVGREQYVRIKLRKDTHCLWVGVKRSGRFKSDDALARHLLSFVTAPLPPSPVPPLANLAMEECRFRVYVTYTETCVCYYSTVVASPTRHYNPPLLSSTPAVNPQSQDEYL